MSRAILASLAVHSSVSLVQVLVWFGCCVGCRVEFGCWVEGWCGLGCVELLGKVGLDRYDHVAFVGLSSVGLATNMNTDYEVSLLHIYSSVCTFCFLQN